MSMRVVEPKDLKKHSDHRSKKQRGKRRRRGFTFFILLTLSVYCAVVLMLPIAGLQADTSAIKLSPAQSVALPWPAYDEAAIGAVNYGLLAEKGEQKPLPTASVAKVITAVAILKVHPIQPDTQGDTITLTAADVATYNAFSAQDQSVVKVEAGEKITEYQALQALLLPSANNMADTLVRWAFGSTENYLTFVNPFVKTLGMQNTHVSDASGFNPATTSTAVDLTKLAEIAMNHPVISEIVGQRMANIPVAGTIYNYNTELGHEGIVGIKTGNTDEAGGCYMFAAKRKVNNKDNIVVVGTIMGAPDRLIAIKDALPLLDEAFKNFTSSTPVTTNQLVGTITQAGGSHVPIVVRQGMPVVSWAGQAPKAQVSVDSLGASVKLNDTVGNLTLQNGSMTYKLPLAAGGTITARSWLWRLRHAAGYL